MALLGRRAEICASQPSDVVKQRIEDTSAWCGQASVKEYLDTKHYIPRPQCRTLQCKRKFVGILDHRVQATEANDNFDVSIVGRSFWTGEIE